MSAEIIFALACATAAIVYGIVSVKWILAKPSGNERMQEIAGAIQEGAKAYLNRQYMTIGMAGIVLFLVIGFSGIGWSTAVGFAIGAVFSGLAGYIGMHISVRANVRTAEAANQGLDAAMQIAFRGGAITGIIGCRRRLRAALVRAHHRGSRPHRRLARRAGIASDVDAQGVG